MNTSDLDALRARWAAANRTIDAHLQLDADAMRAALTKQRNAAFRRLGRSFFVSALINLVGCAWIASQLIANWGDALYFCATLALLPLVGFALAEDMRHMRGVARLDFTAPVQQVRVELDALRAGRLRLAKWIALLSVLLWWPFVAVVMRWLIGIDLLRGLHLSVWVGTIAVGLLFVPLGLWVASLATRRFGSRPGYEGFLDEVIGTPWMRARRAFDAETNFDPSLPEIAEFAHRGVTPANLRPVVRGLRWRLAAGMALSVTAILALGAFNALHGGQWWFLVPGVLVNLACVAQLVACILHSTLLSRLGYGAEPVRLQAEIEGMAAMRRRVARYTLAAAPLIALLLAQVLAKVLFGTNLGAMAGVGGVAVALTMAVVVGLWLLRRLGRTSDAGSMLVDALTLGAASGTSRLATAIAVGDADREPQRDSIPRG